MDIISEKLKYPYLNEIPLPLQSFAACPSIQRLKHVGMNCGCEYTSFPLFQRSDTYQRYEHSLGVALIVWRFTGDLKQAVAGLLHDISTPVFAHVIDFLRGDYMNQEATEEGTAERIAADPLLMEKLDRYSLSLEDVCDYHRYPVADNDSPRLSADRLEYTIGNILQYSFGSRETIDEIYQDLSILIAEDGMPEIGFLHADTAFKFSKLSLMCSRLYVSPEDRYAMQRLAELIRSALCQGVLSPDCLYTTEPEIISRLDSDPAIRKQWNAYKSLRSVQLSNHPDNCLNPRIIHAKKRYIDPLIKGKGRVSHLFPEYHDALDNYLNESQENWISEI